MYQRFPRHIEKATGRSSALHLYDHRRDGFLSTGEDGLPFYITLKGASEDQQRYFVRVLEDGRFVSLQRKEHSPVDWSQWPDELHDMYMSRGMKTLRPTRYRKCRIDFENLSGD